MAQAKQPDQEPANPFGGVAIFVVGGLVGLLVLVGLARLSGEPAKRGPIQELPHVAILASCPGTIERAEVRQALVELQREVEALGLAVMGPANYPILVPGPTPGDLPQPRRLDQVSAEEWQAARPYLARGGWLVPRLYSSNLTEAVIRAAPPRGGRFPAGCRESLEQLALRFADRLGGPVQLYSRALGLEDEAARGALNAGFGVQTANVAVVLPATAPPGESLRDRNALEGLAKQLASLPPPPAALSVTSMASFFVYAESVRTHVADGPVPLSAAPWDALWSMVDHAGVPSLVAADGKRAMIQICTSAEGEANLDLLQYYAANIRGPGAAQSRVER